MRSITFENNKMVDFLFNLPEGSSLYSPLFGYIKVKEANDAGIMMTVPTPNDTDPSDFLFSYDGHAAGFDNGECLLFISHLYRSWNVLNFQRGDIVAIDFKSKEGHTLTFVVIFGEMAPEYSPNINTITCLCKNTYKLTPYAQIDLRGISQEEESVELRYATPREEKLLSQSLESIGERWDKQKQSLVMLDSEYTTSDQLSEDFSALQKEYNRLSEHCKKLEQERDEVSKRVIQEVGRILEVVQALGQIFPRRKEHNEIKVTVNRDDPENVEFAVSNLNVDDVNDISTNPDHV